MPLIVFILFLLYNINKIKGFILVSSAISSTACLQRDINELYVDICDLKRKSFESTPFAVYSKAIDYCGLQIAKLRFVSTNHILKHKKIYLVRHFQKRVRSYKRKYLTITNKTNYVRKNKLFAESYFFKINNCQKKISARKTLLQRYRTLKICTLAMAILAILAALFIVGWLVASFILSGFSMMKLSMLMVSAFSVGWMGMQAYKKYLKYSLKEKELINRKKISQVEKFNWKHPKVYRIASLAIFILTLLLSFVCIGAFIWGALSASIGIIILLEMIVSALTCSWVSMQAYKKYKTAKYKEKKIYAHVDQQYLQRQRFNYVHPKILKVTTIVIGILAILACVFACTALAVGLLLHRLTRDHVMHLVVTGASAGIKAYQSQDKARKYYKLTQ